MPSKIFNLTFPKKRVKEPIIYQLGHKFKIITNIRKANVTSDYGWGLVEFEGELEEIKKAEEYLRNLGVIVEDVEAEDN